MEVESRKLKLSKCDEPTSLGQYPRNHVISLTRATIFDATHSTQTFDIPPFSKYDHSSNKATHCFHKTTK